jgi:glycosyltransferase involved in cell wall biosynthesis
MQPRVLHASTDGMVLRAAVAALLCGVPRIVLAFQTLAPPRHRHWPMSYRRLYRALAGSSRVVVTANSRAGARDYARWLGLPSRRVSVIANGIDPPADLARARRRGGEIRSHLVTGPEQPVVGGLFRLEPVKDPLLWLQVASLLHRRNPEVRYLIVGTGVLHGAVEAEIRRLGLDGVARLIPGTDDPYAHIAAMDVMLLTSDREGIPNVLLEAQSLGVPVVTPDVGGCREAVDHERSGLVVSPRRAAALAGAVSSILGDEAFRVRARSAGPRFVEERFGRDQMLAATLRAYGLADGVADA